MSEPMKRRRGPAPLLGPLGIKPVAYAHDSVTGNHLMIAQFRDRLGVVKSLAVPMEVFGRGQTALFPRLADAMYPVPSDPKRRLAVFDRLNNVDAKRMQKIELVGRVGWFGTNFLYGERRLQGISGKIIQLRDEEKSQTPYRVAGDLEHWHEQIGRHCEGNSRLIFAVSTAFAAPLVGLSQAESAGFCFYGESRTGKSTCSFVASSVVGHPSGIRSADTSLAGLEGVASLHNDMLMCVEELSQTTTEAASRFSHKIGDQHKAVRGRPDGTLRPIADPTRVLALTTANARPSVYGFQPNKATAAAAAVRLLAIPAEPKGASGVFERVPDEFMPDVRPGRLFAQHLKEAANTVHGAPFAMFIDRLVRKRGKDETALVQWIRGVRNEFTEHVLAAGADPVAANAADRFGLVLAGGLLARKFGVLRWSKKQIHWAIETCYRDYLAAQTQVQDAGSDAGVKTDQQIVEAVRAFIRTHSAEFVELCRGVAVDRARLVAAVGFIDRRKPRAERLLLKLALLERAIGPGVTPKRLADALDRAGLLIKTPDRRRIQVLIKGLSKSKQDFYGLPLSILTETLE